jgi:branched-subunit amino acid permease
MDQKTIISNVVTAVVTAGVLGVIAWAGGVFSAGSTALDEAQIEAVVGKILVRDTGATYGASLASIDISLATINTSIGSIKDDIDDLEDSVSILVAE